MLRARIRDCASGQTAVAPPTARCDQPANIYGNNVQVNNIVDSTIHCGRNDDYVSSINAIVKCDLAWDIIPSQDHSLYTLIPHTQACTVDASYVHSDSKHSRYILTRSRMVARCFSHRRSASSRAISPGAFGSCSFS